MTTPLTADELREIREKAERCVRREGGLQDWPVLLSPQTVLRLIAIAEERARLVDELERLREFVRVQANEIDALQERIPRRFGE